MQRVSKYKNWSREALISRIQALESAATKELGAGVNTLTADTSATRSDTKNVEVPNSTKKPVKKTLDFNKFTKRKVAIRFAYLGWKYHGLAFQKDGQKTVEGEILNAFYKTKCIPSLDPVDCNFSRCGRTDADVSAMAQVISLDLRSSLSIVEQQDPTFDSKELDYLKILNSNLPADILAYQISLRPPPGFDARFSCISRHYHYYFNPAGLDIQAMQKAAGYLVGEHDFRNFCKIDGSKQITNFKRRVLRAEILQEPLGGMCYLSLKGTAFLWNQVRSIMAILFMVGQGHESTGVVLRLLDVDNQPRRPAYEIAWGVPLTLYNCEYEQIEWKSSSYTSTESLYNEWNEFRQKQAMSQTMLNVVQPFAQDLPLQSSRINVGRGVGTRSATYVKLFDRPLCETPETVNRRWIERKERKNERSNKNI